MLTDAEQTLDPALKAANVALSGRKTQEARRFASIELRFADPSSGAWEAAAVAVVVVASVLFVLGVWFL